MKQNIRLIKQNIWFNKIEPFAQIEIMKIIALSGFLSKKNIEAKLKKSQKLIDAIVSKMLDEKNKLIQPVKLEKEQGTKKSTFYALTEKGIRILLENHFEESQKNIEKEISAKPYLDVKELIIFLNRFKEDYIQQNPTEDFPNWESPKLTEKTILDSYIKANPKSTLLLGQECQKYDSKLTTLLNNVKKMGKKFDDAQMAMAEAIYETMIFNLKK